VDAAHGGPDAAGVTSASAVAAPPRVAKLVMASIVPFGAGYFFAYLYRVINAVIAPYLVTEFSLSPADLGFLTSAYFMTYAAAQLPLGVLLDRYGPRRTQTGMLCIAATGALVFGLAHSFTMLTVGRALIGLGLCGGLMSCLKANALWWPRERLPLVNGICGGIGAAGALAGTVPVQFALGFIDWHTLFFILVAGTLAVSLFIFLTVPEKAGSASTASLGTQIREMRVIYTSAFYWRTTAFVCLHQGVYLAYQTLWLAPWLRDVAGYDRLQIANTLFCLNLSQFVGAILVGALAERLQRRGITPRACNITAIAISLVVQTLFAAGVTDFATLQAMVYAFAGAATLLVYSILNQHFPAHLAGRVNTLQNMMMFSTAFAAQWGIGAIINLFPGDPMHYSTAAHQTAFFVMIGFQLVAFVYCVWPRRSIIPASERVA
jgi:MFS family permease